MTVMLVQCRKIEWTHADAFRSVGSCRASTRTKAWSGNDHQGERRGRSARPHPSFNHPLTFNSLLSRRSVRSDSEKTPFAAHCLKAESEEGEERWDWFEWSAYNEKFEVPWDGRATVLGMATWFLTSATIGLAFVPQFMRLSGVTSFSQLPGTQQATCLFLTQFLETAGGLGVIYVASGRWSETWPSSSEVFNFSLKKPFEKRRGWLIWALIGISLSLAVNFLLSIALYGLGVQGSGAGTVDAVLNMLAPNPRTFVSLLAVVGVLAPLLEETVFRGFLLTSLMKWMPTYQAIGISSFLFGCAHLTAKDLPYLTVVGAVWGFMYVRSKNLATPMLMHGLWNSSVLTLLYILAAMGFDLKELI